LAEAKLKDRSPVLVAWAKTAIKFCSSLFDSTRSIWQEQIFAACGSNKEPDFLKLTENVFGKITFDGFPAPAKEMLLIAAIAMIKQIKGFMVRRVIKFTKGLRFFLEIELDKPSGANKKTRRCRSFTW